MGHSVSDAVGYVATAIGLQGNEIGSTGWGPRWTSLPTTATAGASSTSASLMFPAAPSDAFGVGREGRGQTAATVVMLLAVGALGAFGVARAVLQVPQRRRSQVCSFAGPTSHAGRSTAAWRRSGGRPSVLPFVDSRCAWSSAANVADLLVLRPPRGGHADAVRLDRAGRRSSPACCGSPWLVRSPCSRGAAGGRSRRALASPGRWATSSYGGQLLAGSCSRATCSLAVGPAACDDDIPILPYDLPIQVAARLAARHARVLSAAERDATRHPARVWLRGDVIPLLLLPPHRHRAVAAAAAALALRRAVPRRRGDRAVLRPRTCGAAPTASSATSSPSRRSSC